MYRCVELRACTSILYPVANDQLSFSCMERTGLSVAVSVAGFKSGQNRRVGQTYGCSLYVLKDRLFCITLDKTLKWWVERPVESVSYGKGQLQPRWFSIFTFRLMSSGRFSERRKSDEFSVLTFGASAPQRGSQPDREAAQGQDEQLHRRAGVAGAHL